METRPDSGVPSVSVLKCLDILWEEFGGTINSKGYKVLHPQVRVIQGDGIDINTLAQVLTEIKTSGYATENVAFGSGGGLLQKVNRDTLRFAMKASYIEVDGVGREVYKNPITQQDKQSKKGKLSLFKNVEGVYRTRVIGTQNISDKEVLETVYENGKLIRNMTFEEVRTNAGG